MGGGAATESSERQSYDESGEIQHNHLPKRISAKNQPWKISWDSQYTAFVSLFSETGVQWNSQSTDVALLYTVPAHENEIPSLHKVCLKSVKLTLIQKPFIAAVVADAQCL